MPRRLYVTKNSEEHTLVSNKLVSNLVDSGLPLELVYLQKSNRDTMYVYHLADTTLTDSIFSDDLTGTFEIFAREMHQIEETKSLLEKLANVQLIEMHRKLVEVTH